MDLSELKPPLMADFYTLHVRAESPGAVPNEVKFGKSVTVYTLDKYSIWDQAVGDKSRKDDSTPEDEDRSEANTVVVLETAAGAALIDQALTWKPEDLDK